MNTASKNKTPAKYTLLAVQHVIEHNPGCSTDKVADLADLCEGTVLRAAKVLLDEHLIEHVPNHGGRGYAYKASPTTRMQSLLQKISILDTRVGGLLSANVRLQDWKQAAIEKYPDLADPDPVTLRVRELLIEDWPEDAEHINEGLWDEKNAAKALRRQVEAEA
jgi:hypothetical protein